MGAPPLYDTLGRGYDETRRAEPAIVDGLAERIEPRPAGRYLDLACGTGSYSAALSARGGVWCGVDVSSLVLATARAKAPAIGLARAEASALPFADGAFDGASCTLAIHHFDDRTAAFAEVRRVLRRGRFALFTSSPEQMEAYWLGAYFPEAMRRSIQQMPPLAEVERALLEAGFADVETEPFFVAPDHGDLFLYAGKHRPELYLDERVRRGISTFASLAPPGEVERGCEALRRDIARGAFEAVRARYDGARGDYSFLSAGLGLGAGASTLP